MSIKDETEYANQILITQRNDYSYMAISKHIRNTDDEKECLFREEATCPNCGCEGQYTFLRPNKYWANYCPICLTSWIVVRNIANKKESVNVN